MCSDLAGTPIHNRPLARGEEAAGGALGVCIRQRTSWGAGGLPSKQDSTRPVGALIGQWKRGCGVESAERSIRLVTQLLRAFRVGRNAVRKKLLPLPVPTSLLISCGKVSRAVTQELVGGLEMRGLVLLGGEELSTAQRQLLSLNGLWIFRGTRCLLEKFVDPQAKADHLSPPLGAWSHGPDQTGYLVGLTLSFYPKISSSVSGF